MALSQKLPEVGISPLPGQTYPARCAVHSEGGKAVQDYRPHLKFGNLTVEVAGHEAIA